MGIGKGTMKKTSINEVSISATYVDFTENASFDKRYLHNKMFCKQSCSGKVANEIFCYV